MPSPVCNGLDGEACFLTWDSWLVSIPCVFNAYCPPAWGKLPVGGWYQFPNIRKEESLQAFTQTRACFWTWKTLLIRTSASLLVGFISLYRTLRQSCLLFLPPPLLQAGLPQARGCIRANWNARSREEEEGNPQQNWVQSTNPGFSSRLEVSFSAIQIVFGRVAGCLPVPVCGTKGTWHYVCSFWLSKPELYSNRGEKKSAFFSRWMGWESCVDYLRLLWSTTGDKPCSAHPPST